MSRVNISILSAQYITSVSRDHFAVYISHCQVFHDQCKIYSVKSLVSSVNCAVIFFWFLLLSVIYSVSIDHCPLSFFSVLWSVSNVQSAVFTIQCLLFSVQCPSSNAQRCSSLPGLQRTETNPLSPAPHPPRPRSILLILILPPFTVPSGLFSYSN